MLIIGRKRDQKIIINDDIEITILEIGRNRVRFGVQAPKSVRIHTKLQELPSGSAKTGSAESDRVKSVESASAGAGSSAGKVKDPSRVQSLAGAAAGYGRRSR